ncbi:MAG: hypothetical protein AAGB00_07050 [Planctomycetota bacterium]
MDDDDDFYDDDDGFARDRFEDNDEFSEQDGFSEEPLEGPLEDAEEPIGGPIEGPPGGSTGADEGPLADASLLVESLFAGGGEGGAFDDALLSDGAFDGGAPQPTTDAGEQLAWRETYFVLFQRDHRPTLTQVEGALADAGPRLKIENLEADDDGLFQSLLIQAPEDNAALEISYESGDAVVEQSTELAKMLEKQLEGDQLAQLLRADARLDVMHFERVGDEPPLDEEADPESLMMEALDPATLITVVETLSNLTEGLPIDPAAGELLT